MVNCYIFDGYDTGKPVISRVVENTPEVFYLPGGGGEITKYLLLNKMDAFIIKVSKKEIL